MKKLSLLLLISLVAICACAQTYSIIKSFGVVTNVGGLCPQGQLVQGPDGTLYGTTAAGEFNVSGTVFKIQPDGTGFTPLTQFTNFRSFSSSIILNGNTLYGVLGGDTNFVFRLNTDGTAFSILYASTDGLWPSAGLALSGSSLYGTTGGGTNGSGSIFKINTDGTGYQVLKSFSKAIYSLTVGGVTNSDGTQVRGDLLVSGTSIYGTAYSGGLKGDGTIFKMNTDGTGFSVLHTFTNSPDGRFPFGGLVISGSTLYGTTYGGGYAGGNTDGGTIFKINIDGSGYTILHSFKYLTGFLPDGSRPFGRLTVTGNTLYGTTSAGGTVTASSGAAGSVFSINTDGSGYSILHTFILTNLVNGGATPVSGVVVNGSNLYGTTSVGGATYGGYCSASPNKQGFGTVFKLSTDGSSYTVLNDFVGTEGSDPIGSLVTDGNRLYGTTHQGGGGTRRNSF